MEKQSRAGAVVGPVPFARRHRFNRQRLGLAAATLFVLVVSNTSVSLIRAVVSDTISLPVFVMIIAAAVTVTELLMQAYSYELYQILGIFLPLITTNCIILGRADAFARKNAVPAALYDGFIMGVGIWRRLGADWGHSRAAGHRRLVRGHAAIIWRRS